MRHQRLRLLVAAIVLVVLGISPFASRAQNLNLTSGPLRDLDKILGFEIGTGWSRSGRIAFIQDVVRSGRAAARLDGDAANANSFIQKRFEIDFIGETIELRGFLRTADVSGFAGLSLREDGDSGPLASADMKARQLNGTTDWTEYSVSLPVYPEARRFSIFAGLTGTGKVWVDDLQVLIDGKPIWEAPRSDNTVLTSDHEFDSGSRVSLRSLTSVQIDNLVTLGKVWGFLKYHHPRVTSGQLHWDYALFRILPDVLAAPDRASSNGALQKWVDTLGPVNPCSACTALEEHDKHGRTLRVHPNLNWISDEGLLGVELSRSLQGIYRNRSGDQYFVSLLQQIGPQFPAFQHELGYGDIKIPDAGLQLLALYRFWNIAEYWSPYRRLIEENWDKVLADSIPRIALAQDSKVYQLELLRLIARLKDSHTSPISSVQGLPPAGACQLPVLMRFIEGQPVISGYLGAGSASGLQPGDVVLSFDGRSIDELIAEWKPYYWGSNEPRRLFNMARFITRGECAEASLRIRRQSATLDLKVNRVPSAGVNAQTHDLAGNAFRLLSPDIAYLKLSTADKLGLENYIQQAARTKGLIIDVRNYPDNVSGLLSFLIEKETRLGAMLFPDLSNPGAFYLVDGELQQPAQPHYPGKVVVILDEVTGSRAEGIAEILSLAPRATVVGSTTAGVPGPTANISLPGNLRTQMTVGVRDLADPRRGIIPDVEAKPTIAGIRAGRDEVVEEALRQILGPDIPAAQIQELAK